MICVFICLTLLTMIATLHMLAKVNKENLGSFFKWSSYFILLIATCVLVCQIICCTSRCMKHKGKCNGMEQCGGIGHKGVKCSDKKDKCKQGGMKCDDEKKCPHQMMMVDTVKGK